MPPAAEAPSDQTVRSAVCLLVSRRNSDVVALRTSTTRSTYSTAVFINTKVVRKSVKITPYT